MTFLGFSFTLSGISFSLTLPRIPSYNFSMVVVLLKRPQIDKMYCLFLAPDPCTNYTCGEYAYCLVENNTAVCACLYGFTGNPYEYCTSGKFTIMSNAGQFATPQFATAQPNFKFLIRNRNCTFESFCPLLQVRYNVIPKIRTASPQPVEKAEKKVEKVKTANMSKKDNKKLCISCMFEYT